MILVLIYFKERKGKINKLKKQKGKERKDP